MELFFEGGWTPVDKPASVSPFSAAEQRMNRAIQLGPIIFALIGASAGLCAGMLGSTAPYRVHFENSLPLLFLGGFVGTLLGAVLRLPARTTTGLSGQSVCHRSLSSARHSLRRWVGSPELTWQAGDFHTRKLSVTWSTCRQSGWPSARASGVWPAWQWAVCSCSWTAGELAEQLLRLTERGFVSGCGALVRRTGGERVRLFDRKGRGRSGGSRDQS